MQLVTREIRKKKIFHKNSYFCSFFHLFLKYEHICIIRQNKLTFINTAVLQFELWNDIFASCQ